jgi:quercetin dioxygenase-like cupin family protein
MENISLTALTREQLELARAASSGRAARTVFGGHQHTLRQTVIALAADQRLDEHENPGEATLYVLHGRVRLVAGDTEWRGAAGHFMVVPDMRHTLVAEEDSAVLLTTAVAR